MPPERSPLEQIAYARAIDGVEEPIIRNGEVVGYRRRGSDSTLMKLIERVSGVAGQPAGPRGRGGFGGLPPAKEIEEALIARLEALVARRKEEEEESRRKRCAQRLAKGKPPCCQDPLD